GRAPQSLTSGVRRPNMPHSVKPTIKKRLLLAALIMAALYVVSFSVLIYNGGYLWVPSGHFRPINHLAMADTLVWQPQVGRYYAFRTASGDDTYQSDNLGSFYSPLIFLWQRFAAPSIRTVAADGTPLKARLPRRDQLHPTARRELPEVERTFGLTWEQIAVRFASGESLLPQ